MKQLKWIAWILLCAVAECLGCGGRASNSESLGHPVVFYSPPAEYGDVLTKSNYDQIKIGMTQEQVLKVFSGVGPRKAVSSPDEIYDLVWVQGEKKILVRFKGNTCSDKLAVKLDNEDKK